MQFLLGDSSSGEESVSVSSSKKVSTSAKEAPTVSPNISVGAFYWHWCLRHASQQLMTCLQATIHKSASTGGSMGAGNTDNLQEQNRRLMEENQRLQRENKRLKETLRLEELPARVREVEERNTQLTRVSLLPCQHAVPASPVTSHAGCCAPPRACFWWCTAPGPFRCIHCFAFYASCCGPPWLYRCTCSAALLNSTQACLLSSVLLAVRRRTRGCRASCWA